MTWAPPIDNDDSNIVDSTFYWKHWYVITLVTFGKIFLLYDIISNRSILQNLSYSLKPKSLECMIVFVDDAMSAQIHSIWTKSLSLTLFFSTSISTSINITFLTSLLSFNFIFIFIGIEAFKLIRIQAIRFSPEGRVEILHFLSQRVLCWNSNLEVIYFPFPFDFIFFHFLLFWWRFR